jgi:formylmethanofuran dehydrogenase subunit E
MTPKHVLPDWIFEFHGHRCPFVPIGYRMGQVALRELGVAREKDSQLQALSEMGSGHHNTCMEDGIQAATGCTYAKRNMEHIDYGKAAMLLYHPDHPEKGAVRVSLKPEAFDELGKFEFIAYRKKGAQPSEIPEKVSQEIVDWVLSRSDEELLSVEHLRNFVFQKPGSKTFAKVKCVKCGEYVFEPQVKIVGGRTHCIPCSGFTK